MVAEGLIEGKGVGSGIADIRCPDIERCCLTALLASIRAPVLVRFDEQEFHTVGGLESKEGEYLPLNI